MSAKLLSSGVNTVFQRLSLCIVGLAFGIAFFRGERASGVGEETAVLPRLEKLERYLEMGKSGDVEVEKLTIRSGKTNDQIQYWIQCFDVTVTSKHADKDINLDDRIPDTI